jgi:uncharacterized protein (TIGR02001 family)
MKKRISSLGSLLCLCLASPAAFAQDDEGAAEATGPHTFSVSLWAVSDYRWRGVSQSQEDPAFQAAFDYEHESGFYAGVWGSSVDFTDDDTLAEDEDSADIEVDFYVGYSFDITERLAGDVSLMRYFYPDVAEGIDYDYNELTGQLTWDEWLTFLVAYSNDEFASGETGIYYNIGGEWSLPAELTLTAGVGYFDLDDTLGDSYVDWNVGLTRAFGPFELALTYVDTNGGGEELYGRLADESLVASVKFGF